MSKEKVDRRGYVKYAAAGIVVVAVAGAGAYYATRQGPAPEVTPGEPLKFGIAMWGFHDEGIWDSNAYACITALQNKYDIDVRLSEEVTLTDIERILRLRAETDDVVWAHSHSYEEAVKPVAADFPDTTFISEYAFPRPGHYTPNVVTFGQTPLDENFLCGALAAKLSSTKKIGFIQSLEEAGVTIFSTAYRQGAHYVDSNVEVSRVVMNAYVDPVRTRDAIRSFAEAGVDIVFVQMDDTSGTLEAKEQGIYSMQAYKDVTNVAPDTIICCGVWNFTPLLDKIINAKVSGTWDSFIKENEFMPLKLEDNSQTLGTYGNMVTDEDKDFIENLKQQIINGEISVKEETEW